MHIPDAWREQARKIISKPGVALVIGRVNTGKSTLTRYLLQAALHAGLKALVVDTDLGQASIGPPTCMSLTPWPDGPTNFRFVGATSPAGQLLQVTVGAKLLVERAREQGAGLVVVDTSGMVQGPQGTLLKRFKIELIRPRYLLVLQKGGELEGLLGKIPRPSGMELCRLPLSPDARPRSAAERTLYRQERFAAYFQEAAARWIDLRRPMRFLSGLPPRAGRVVGLINPAGETLGLGVMRRHAAERVELLTPVLESEPIRFLEVSGVRLDEDCRELHA